MSAQKLSKSLVAPLRGVSPSVVRGLTVVMGAVGLWGGADLLSLGLLKGRAIAQVGLSPMLIQAEMAQDQIHNSQIHNSQIHNNITRTVSVTNPSDEPMRVRMYAEPFTYDRMNGFVLLDEDSRDLSRDLTPHLQFSPGEFVLEANAKQQVQVMGSLPPSLTETEYRAVILADSVPENASVNSAQAIVQTRIGSTLYVRQSDSKPLFSIVSAQWSTDENQAQLLVRNVGEATARPNARWTIMRGGETVATGQSGATTVIEGGDRLIPLPYYSESGADLPPGNYEIRGALTWHFGAEQASQPFSANLRVQ
ncbi:MAG: hypothetical protein AB8B99_01705 [Phormidesmis sp.]